MTSSRKLINDILVLLGMLNTYSFTQNKGSGAVNITISTPTVGSKWELVDIRMHLGAVGESGILYISTSDTDSSYNTNLLTQDMETVQDLRENDFKTILDSDEEISITWANGNSVNWGITVITRELS